MVLILRAARMAARIRSDCSKKKNRLDDGAHPMHIREEVHSNSLQLKYIMDHLHSRMYTVYKWRIEDPIFFK